MKSARLQDITLYESSWYKIAIFSISYLVATRLISVHACWGQRVKNHEVSYHWAKHTAVQRELLWCWDRDDATIRAYCLTSKQDLLPSAVNLPWHCCWPKMATWPIARRAKCSLLHDVVDIRACFLIVANCHEVVCMSALMQWCIDAVIPETGSYAGW